MWRMSVSRSRIWMTLVVVMVVDRQRRAVEEIPVS
jgi:hypothetical protein